MNQMETVFGSNPNEYEIKAELSSCCFGIGTVYLAKHKTSQQFAALKKFQMDKAKDESNLILVNKNEMLFLFSRRSSYNNSNKIEFSFFFANSISNRKKY